MADKKISALTAATTPLAGTEVLPIVQSGVTKQVSVADLTAGCAVSAASLTLTTALAATSGGTGQSSYAVGDLLYASTTTALSKLADVATGNALISGGVGVAPSWGKIGLTTHVSGTLGVTNGGTGLSSATTGDLLYASGTNTWASLAIGSSNKVLTSSGTAPQWSTSLSLAGSITGYSVGVSANQNVITGGMWYQTSGGLLVMTPATTGGFAWNNYANTVQIASIDNSGNAVFASGLTTGSDILINAGSGNPKLTVKTAGSGNNPVVRLQFGSDYWDIQGTGSNAGKELYFQYDGASRSYINSSTGAYTAVSDRNLKKNITDISLGLSAVMALRPVEYLMNNETDDAQKHLGFIAQEARGVVPSSVSEMIDGILGMDKTEIIPVIVKAIHELDAKINTLLKS
jgi:hypothetical protein